MADVPSTDEVRDIWVDWHLNPLPRAEGIALVPEYQEAFDEWLETVRAHERVVEDVRRDMVEERSDRLEQRLLSIYKNVEHMRDVSRKYIDSQRDVPGSLRDVPGSFIAVSVGRREALDDVLALFETEAYPERVGDDG